VVSWPATKVGHARASLFTASDGRDESLHAPANRNDTGNEESHEKGGSSPLELGRRPAVALHWSSW